MHAFDGMGAQPTGMLLSQRDSIVYRRALSPELRLVGRNERVHRIADYGAADAREKQARIAEILHIAREGGYTHLFAGYGFMAEDHEFIQAIEEAGLGFVGPSAKVARHAGAKDAAKALARSLGVSVTPGIDNPLALALLAKAPRGRERAYLDSLAREHGLDVAGDANGAPEQAAERVLEAARRRGVALVTLAELQRETRRQVERLFRESPGTRLRLKHIAGGGGKGQRIVSAPDEVAAAVFEVLNEAKATGPGDNSNFLIEVNIERTRHNEIQLLGNGSWCVALGGRDCSLQMNEQKLLEVSVTQELLSAAARRYEERGLPERAAVLRADLASLQAMEAEAERLGQAVGLDSASTFECIVAGDRHFFMEINTRIQVEHRVTEMVYGLRFTNPEQPHEVLEVDSLVEAMLWLAVHGSHLPRPERTPRHGSGAEVRINATNAALRPHAGGIVLHWSPPLEHEIRDDQGIGIANPDTRRFIPYNLSGAYDSNAALIVSHGEDREETFRRLAEILRRMELRGDDVQTNQHFHYGLLHWMLGVDPLVKPDTRFVTAYLAAVGALWRVSRDLDLALAWDAVAEAAAGESARQALAAKATLIGRPLERLFADPHLLAGWLAPRTPQRWVLEQGTLVWRQNPLDVLAGLYRYLRLEEHPGVSPEEKIWDHDQQALRDGLDFYAELRARLGPEADGWRRLCERVHVSRPPKGWSKAEWEAVQAAHRGHQAGLQLLGLPILCGEASGFHGLAMDNRLEPAVPAPFREPAALRQAIEALAPPPAASGDVIVAWTGGTFYRRPGPDQPSYVGEGERVGEGDVLGLLEVMKMFNPIRAPFAGTIRKALLPDAGGAIVHKGQPLFEVDPDVPVVVEGEEDAARRRAERTRAMLARL
ncbi:MAG: biotin carboxylase [Candidatus Lambdaproteobacteria bacterium]|nr:biotin carboxylase [Candidatus Lambdaproteobacteria bacterium]